MRSWDCIWLCWIPSPSFRTSPHLFFLHIHSIYCFIFLFLVGDGKFFFVCFRRFGLEYDSMRFFEGLQRKRVLRHIPRSSYSRPFYLKKEKKLKDAVQLIYADLAVSEPMCGVRFTLWSPMVVWYAFCVAYVGAYHVWMPHGVRFHPWSAIPALDEDPHDARFLRILYQLSIPNFLKHVQVLFRGTGIIYFSVPKCQIKVYASWLSV